MATSTLVPLSEYLRTSYRPDRDWVDGEVRERNMGEGPHGNIQVFLAFIFKLRAKPWGVRVYTEQRVQTSEAHYRIADVCAIEADAPFEKIVRIPPLLCVEILSSCDGLRETQERASDYFNMGVAAVWIIDPQRRQAYSAGTDRIFSPVTEALTVRGTEIRVPLAEMFAELNELESRA